MAKGSAYSFLILGMPENKVELGIKANSSQFVGDYIVEFKKTQRLGDCSADRTECLYYLNCSDEENLVRRCSHTLEELRRACDAEDRDFDTIEITCSASMDQNHIKALEEVGVHRVTLPLFGLAGEKDIFSGLDALGEFIQKLG